MGKIKSKGIRRAAETLHQNGVEFSEDFKENKQILNRMTISKKLRNQLAGLLSRNKKQSKNNS